MWIVDNNSGDVLCEIDCGCDLSQIAEELRACVQSAYDWAISENADMTEEVQAGDEVEEWLYEYNISRG